MVNRVLYINRHSLGGAGKAGSAIVRIFRDLGFVVDTLSGDKTSKFILLVYRMLAKLKFNSEIFNYSQIPIFRQHNLTGYGIVILNWFGDGIFDIRVLRGFKGRIFVVVHDLYPFTGGCHYSNLCDDFLIGCTSCPKARFALSKGLISWECKVKRDILNRDNVVFVYPSNSFRTRLAPVYDLAGHLNIKNVLEFEASGNIARVADKKRPLRFVFGASDLSDPRKGMKVLSSVLENLLQSSLNVEFVSFGNNPLSLPGIRHLGVLKEIEMVSLFKSADYLIFPSLEENYSYVVLESLICGCPVIAFDIGGNSEMITHGKNGYIIEPSILEKFLYRLIRNHDILIFETGEIKSNHSYIEIKERWKEILEETLL